MPGELDRVPVPALTGCAAAATLVWVRREAVWEYLRGALWVLPTIAVVVALVVGYVLSQVEVSSTRWFVFQGTPAELWRADTASGRGFSRTTRAARSRRPVSDERLRIVAAALE